jgi:hypothetical protein
VGIAYYFIFIGFMFSDQQMTSDEDITSNVSGGGASLDGYLYQVDISIWVALDLLLAKKLSAETAQGGYRLLSVCGNCRTDRSSSHAAFTNGGLK